MKYSSLIPLPMLVLVIALFFISSPPIASAQPAEEWNRTYVGPYYDKASSVQQTSDGGYIIAGYTGPPGPSEDDFYLVKTDSEGVEEWSKTYGGAYSDLAYSVQQTTDGGYIIAGSTESFGAGKDDFYLVKTDSEGVEEWSKTYGGACSDLALSVQQTTDGGYIIAGYTESFGAGERDFYLVKTNSQGKVEWSRTYGGSIDEVAYSVQQISDGGYIIAGYTESFGIGDVDFYLIKTDSQGMEEWSKTYGGGVRNWAYSIQQTSDGGYIVAGTTMEIGRKEKSYYEENLYLVKTDSQGGEKWSKTYNTEFEFCSVQQTFDGGYIVAGYRGIVSYLTKVDSQGRMEWTTDYRAYGRPILKSIQRTSDGGYILVGDLLSLDSIDIYLIKLASERSTSVVPTTSTSSVATPTDEGVRRPPYVNLYAHKTDVTLGEEVILTLSTVNPITSPGTLIINLSLYIPEEFSITTSGFAHSGTEGLLTTTYEVKQGSNRIIEAHILANKRPRFGLGRISAHAEYCFAEQSESKYYVYEGFSIDVHHQGEPSFNLSVGKTTITKEGEEITLRLSATNPVTSPGTLIVDFCFKNLSGIVLDQDKLERKYGNFYSKNTYEVKKGSSRVIDFRLLTKESINPENILSFIWYYYAEDPDTLYNAGYFQITKQPIDQDHHDLPTIPEFEAIFAIAGLLAVAYLMRRKGDKYEK